MAGYVESGVLPEAGGLLDQTASFRAACREFWHWQAEADKTKKKRHGG